MFPPTMVGSEFTTQVNNVFVFTQVAKQMIMIQNYRRTHDAIVQTEHTCGILL